MPKAEHNQLAVRQLDAVIAPDQSGDELIDYLEKIEAAVSVAIVGEVKRVSGEQADWDAMTGGKIPDQIL